MPIVQIGGKRQAEKVGSRRICKKCLPSFYLLNWMPFTVAEKNETGQVGGGAGENHDFGCRHVEFKLPLNHVRTKYAAGHKSSELRGTI